MTRVTLGFAALGVLALTGSMLAAHAPASGAPAGGGQRAASPPPEPPKNLQVLPKDIPRAQLVQRMQAMSQALGVQCGYCHVFDGASAVEDEAAAGHRAFRLRELADVDFDDPDAAVGKAGARARERRRVDHLAVDAQRVAGRRLRR